MRVLRRWLLIGLILLGALLRVHGLDRSALRGDEAFAVRYWAAPPADLLRADGLAWIEPHPLGAFFVFGAWKALAGESEYAMRLLPALINLLGIPACFMLCRRLWPGRDGIRAGLFAALLWAINPFLIWHSQDVRSYALWAGISAAASAALLRMAGTKRRGFAGYVLAGTGALYLSFLESFQLAANGSYVLLARRMAFTRWLRAALIMAALCAPLAYQVWRLAGSGYRGALSRVSLEALWAFPGVLAFGETLPDAWRFAADLMPLCVLITLALAFRLDRRAGIFVACAMIVPLLALIAAATRLDVFGPRYLMAAMPALCAAGGGAFAFGMHGKTGLRRLALILPALFVIPGLASVVAYYDPGYHKAPDWQGLQHYLNVHMEPGDSVIMTAADPVSGIIDPAFAYYYRGPYVVLPYPGADTDQFVQKALQDAPTVWFVVSGEAAKGVNEALLRFGQLQSDESAGRSFQVRAYRVRLVGP